MRAVGWVRWQILAALFAVSFYAYVLRLNISVAAEFMMPELGLSEIQMGWIFSSFVWGYALFQFPGGIFGEIVGPRKALTIVGTLWLFTTFLTGFVPGLMFGTAFGILVSLLVIRFVMGVAQAPLYPVTGGAIRAWFPVAGWAFPNGLSTTGLGLGAAVTPPIVAWLMVKIGWRESFYLTIPLGLFVFAFWWWYARDHPGGHPRVGTAELGYINAGRLPSESLGGGGGAWKRLLRNRETLLLFSSYLSMNYVFYIFFSWFFHYLVVVRGFSILGGGIMASLPWLAGAIAAALGGLTCDSLCRRLGPRWGCRIPAMGGMISVAGLLFAGASADDPYVAVALLSLCFAGTQFTDGAFWSGQTFVAGPHTASATGILNTGGNLGGVLSIPLMPWLAHQFGWFLALATGSLFAVISAVLWMFIRVDRPMVDDGPA